LGNKKLNYSQQLEVIRGLSIPPETQTRMDCVFCNGNNTLSIDTTENKISWYCFHASCSAKGKKEGEKNMQYVEKVFFGNTEDIQIHSEFKIPDSFQSIYSNEKAMRWLHNNNCWESWSWGRADFKYDVKQNRVVFLVKNKISDKIVGAVGRSLNKDDYPKWYMYGNKDIPFKCGECNDAVIVEDCPSACAVSNILTGIAIMGTKLKEVQKSHLKPYKNLYICLDRDATTKAYDMAKDLRSSGFDNVIVKPLEDDLKYYNTEQIREMFYG
jgi:DNA primase